MCIRDRDITDSIRSNNINANVSEVSAIKIVREFMVKVQREMAYDIDCVLEGRDIGTVVCPNATAKIYLDANREIRVTRRLKELQLRGMESIEAHVLLEMKERDKRDKKRSVAPLKLAQDAYLIDSSNLTEDEVFENAVCFIEKKYGEVV